MAGKSHWKVFPLIHSLNSDVDETATDIENIRTDISVKNLTGTNLNNFRPAQAGWGRGFNITGAPWGVGVSVEYVPYTADFGTQRATTVEKVGGTYQTAKRTYANGTWSGWEIDNPATNLKRFVLADTVDFNQVTLVKYEDNTYKIHFYNDGRWITSI